MYVYGEAGCGKTIFVMNSLPMFSKLPFFEYSGLLVTKLKYVFQDKLFFLQTNFSKFK